MIWTNRIVPISMQCPRNGSPRNPNRCQTRKWHRTNRRACNLRHNVYRGWNCNYFQADRISGQADPNFPVVRKNKFCIFINCHHAERTRMWQKLANPVQSNRITGIAMLKAKASRFNDTAKYAERQSKCKNANTSPSCLSNHNVPPWLTLTWIVIPDRRIWLTPVMRWPTSRRTFYSA